MINIKLRSTFAIAKTEDLRKKISSGKDLIVEVEPGTHVEELLKKMPWLGPSEEYDDMMMHVFVNGKQKPLDYVLVQDDVVDLHLPVSGG